MFFKVFLFLGLCILDQIASAKTDHQELTSAQRLKRFAEIGGQRVDKSLRKLWHVGIYSKNYEPYMQICGGTLVTPKAVISAAHCFWSESDGVLPGSLFAVGAGKLYRPWHEPMDTDSQTSDVAEIHVPVRYHDYATNYQEDIAVVVVEERFTINEHSVRPACVNFDKDFDDEQLAADKKGTIMGWGLSAEDGNPSQVLTYLELPVVDIRECMSTVDPGFLRFLTIDKICAGVTTGNKALCRGDSGGGLVFSERTDGRSAHFLRGVASTAARGEHACNAHALAALTHLRAHRAFIREIIPDIEQECEQHYPNAYLLRDRPNSAKNRYLLSQAQSTKAPEPVTQTYSRACRCGSYCSCE